MKKKAALVIDGSAQFLVGREIEPERQFDYIAFVRVLMYLFAKIVSGRSDEFLPRNRETRDGLVPYVREHSTHYSPLVPFDPALYFTSYDPENLAQQKFLSFLRNESKWAREGIRFDVTTVDARDAMVIPDGRRSHEDPRPYIRLSEDLAYCIGRLANTHDMVVVTDSYGVARPMLAAKAHHGSIVALAFWFSALDSRWRRHFQSRELDLIDLDEYRDLLFGAGHSQQKPQGSRFPTI